MAGTIGVKVTVTRAAAAIRASSRRCRTLPTRSAAHRQRGLRRGQRKHIGNGDCRHSHAHTLYEFAPRDSIELAGNRHIAAEKMVFLQLLEREPNDLLVDRRTQFSLHRLRDIVYAPPAVTQLPNERGGLVEAVRFVALFVVYENFVIEFSDDESGGTVMRNELIGF